MFPGSVDPYVREVTLRRFSEAIEIARKIQAKFVTIHLNYIENLHEHYLNEWIINAADTFRKLAKLGVPIHVENTREKDPIIFYRILTEVGDPLVGMCLDVGHVVAYSNKSIGEWIRTLSGFIVEFHLHECSPGRDIHEILGYGYIDWSEFLSTIKRYHVDLSKIFLTLEPKDERDLKKDLIYMKNLLDNIMG